MIRGKFANMEEYGGTQGEPEPKARRGAEIVGAPVLGEYGGTQSEPEPKARRGAEIVGAPVLGEYGGHVGAPVTK
jgi:hypothetical protein